MFEGQDLLYGKNMKVRKGKRKGHVKLDVVTDRNNRKSKKREVMVDNHATSNSVPDNATLR